jgi:RHS repeat-associated protein
MSQGSIYDAENKQIEVRDSRQNVIGQYRYDGDGKRIRKIVPSTDEVTVFVYSAGGQLVAEYSTEISQAPKVSYTTADNLGSPRILTDENGATISRRDFHPFGEEVFTPERSAALGYQPDDVRQKFTGYERDTETDLDFAQARYFSSGFGRFSSPDDFMNDTISEDPRSWNLYAYVRNNPVRFIDPLGKDLKRNRKTKEIDFKILGEGTTVFVDNEAILDVDGNPTGKTRTVRWESEYGYVTSKKGKKILAMRAKGEFEVIIKDSDGNVLENESKQERERMSGLGYSNLANCHGQTFAEGKFWIEDNATSVDPKAKDQVKKLLEGAGYNTKNPSATPTDGAISIYSASGGLENVQHSARVTSFNSTTGTGTLLEKNGIMARSVRSSTSPWPMNPSAKASYFSRRTKK